MTIVPPAPPLPIVGLVPAAGRATRLGPLSFSKELYPLPDGAGGGTRPVACHLLGQMARAGIGRALVVLRDGKWDIPARLGDGGALGIHLAYLTLADSRSVVETLDAAGPWLGGCRVALGFPDVLLTPADAFRPLLARQEESGAEVVLGLFPADRPHKCDMVRTDAAGRLLAVEIKPRATELTLTWMIAVWTPAFTALLHRVATGAAGHTGAAEAGELYPSHVLRHALAEGLRVETVSFPHGSCLDIGTPGDLARALRLP